MKIRHDFLDIRHILAINCTPKAKHQYIIQWPNICQYFFFIIWCNCCIFPTPWCIYVISWTIKSRLLHNWRYWHLFESLKNETKLQRQKPRPSFFNCCWIRFRNCSPKVIYLLELVSKESNYFGGSHRFSEIWHQGHWQMAHKPLLMRQLSVSPVPNLGKTTRSPIVI